MTRHLALLAASLAALAAAQPAVAAPKTVTVTIKNLAPTNSVSFAPTRVGFGNGSFDAFNAGNTATGPIVSIAEGGSGNLWFPAFAAADPTAVLGSVGGALLPGQTATQVFTVDSITNAFFTFASMVIPSNDLFIGNDNPQQYRLFDSMGNLTLTTINQSAGQIWDAGSEVANPLNAAFVQGGNNSARIADNGTVQFSFAELAAFNGVTTAAGYTFQTNLTNNTPIFRISFSAVDAAVPEPGTWLTMILGMGLVGGMMRRRQGQGNVLNGMTARKLLA